MRSQHLQKLTILGLIFLFALAVQINPAFSQKIKFDHNHTFKEVVDYLNKVVSSKSDIARLHNIGKSYLGNDLLVLEITNKKTGKAMEKPGFWIDGNLHASEVMGAEVCLKTIETLVNQYGKDDKITNLVDTRVYYVMPKLNPDGSDYYLTKPDGMRSSVRPHDADRDGALDEDPPEDLNGDGYITQMRIKDEYGNMKVSKDDPRLLERCKEDEVGEYRVYSEGIDNDNDERFNEDGVGGLDINRNWPGNWQQEHVQRGAGPYALSEPETRAVAEFLLSHRNITGVVNHHMAGNFLYRPPTHSYFNPATGNQELIPRQDDAVFQLFGKKYSDILYKQKMRLVFDGSNSPRGGGLFGVMIGWAYDHYGVFSWVPEMGSYNIFCDYDSNGTASQAERLKWNDTELNGKIFVDWKSFDHPQLGKVEIGGFLSKVYNPKTKTYNSMMCYPGEKFDEFLAKHSEWNIYLASMSPLVRIVDVKTKSFDSGFYKVEAKIQNQGYLPTNVTQQAINNQTAKPVKVSLNLDGAQLIMGKETENLGHISGNRSMPQKVEWMVKTTKSNSTISIKVVSERGGTDTKRLALK
jgi:murein tripeptide amidase MpaA